MAVLNSQNATEVIQEAGAETEALVFSKFNRGNLKRHRKSTAEFASHPRRIELMSHLEAPYISESKRIVRLVRSTVPGYSLLPNVFSEIGVIALLRSISLAM